MTSCVKVMVVLVLAVATAVAEQGRTGSTQRLAELRDRALDGRLVVLPDSAQGFVTLVGFGFRRESEGPLDSWMKPFEREFKDPAVFRHYEVPMMGGGLARLARGMINGGMRRGTPEREHPYVVPFYGDIKSYAREMAMDTGSGEHVFIYLLDRDGTIHWQGQGEADKDSLAVLFAAARDLAGGS